MNERLMQFRVGVLVLATIIITAILVAIFGKLPAIGESTYELKIKFSDAPGVQPGTPVLKYGILIGRVTEVGFAEDEPGAIVTVAIHSDVRLRADETCRIKKGLLGDSVLEFVRRVPAPAAAEATDEPSARGTRSRPTRGTARAPARAGSEPGHAVRLAAYQEDVEEGEDEGEGDADERAGPPPPAIYLEEGDVIIGEVQSDPLEVAANLERNLAAALESVGRTSDEIAQLARRLNTLLEDEQLDRIVDKTEQTLDRLRVAVESASEVLADPEVKENLRRSIAELPEVLDEARETIGGLRTTLSGVDRNLANIEGLTRPLGERGGELIANIESSTARLDQVLADLATFTASLNDPRGSLGQLLTNPDAYQNINEAARNINELTRELKPIVRDARIFADKIARHPEQLGLRGAVRPGAGLKRSPSELMGAGDQSSTGTSTLRWGR